MGIAISRLEVGNHVWLVDWHGRHEVIGVVSRVTKTQIVVVVDYSFQGGTNHSEQRYRRLNGKFGYGAGREMSGATMKSSLGELATDSEIQAFKNQCDAKHRSRMAFAAQARRKEETRKRLNSVLPENCHVDIHEDSGSQSFSITIGGIESEEQVTDLAQLFALHKTLKRKSA